MKISVEHDANGAIRSIGLAVSGAESKTSLQPGPGLQIAEVDAPAGITEKDYDKLAAIKKSFRLETQGGVSRLAPVK